MFSGIYDTKFKNTIIDKSVEGVEAGSNASTVALRVAGGDEKGTLCLGV
jgi:hypothetical protein